MSSSGIKKAETEEDPKVACGAFVDNAPIITPPVLKTEPRRDAVPRRTESSDTWVARAPIVVDPAVGAGGFSPAPLGWCLAYAGAVILEASAMRSSIGFGGYMITVSSPSSHPPLSPFLV
jgi:hypothetical protein